MINKNEIPIESRKELAKKIDELRNQRELGINQLILRSNLNAKTFYSIMNSENKKINPYNLIHLSSSLKIDYKDLYKIVGYLSEEDFKEAEVLKKENAILEEELLKYKENKKISNSETIDVLGLSIQEIEHLKDYVEFMKTKKERK
ncbi:MAG: hypothetical protein ACRCXY_08500 [Fusobacteriaceae bacterium]